MLLWQKVKQTPGFIKEAKEAGQPVKSDKSSRLHVHVRNKYTFLDQCTRGWMNVCFVPFKTKSFVISAYIVFEFQIKSNISSQKHRATIEQMPVKITQPRRYFLLCHVHLSDYILPTTLKRTHRRRSVQIKDERKHYLLGKERMYLFLSAYCLCNCIWYL